MILNTGFKTKYICNKKNRNILQYSDLDFYTRTHQIFSHERKLELTDQNRDSDDEKCNNFNLLNFWQNDLIKRSQKITSSISLKKY